MRLVRVEQSTDVVDVVEGEAPQQSQRAACGGAHLLHAAVDSLLLGANLAKGEDGGDGVARTQRLEDVVRGAAQHAPG